MPGLYSTTGFDVLGVLSRVVGRANQRTVLGPVDFSCSFLVVVSETFYNASGEKGKKVPKCGRN